MTFFKNFKKILCKICFLNFFLAEYYGFPTTEIFFFRKRILFPFQWGIAWYWTVNNTRDMIFQSYMAKYIKIICWKVYCLVCKSNNYMSLQCLWKSYVHSRDCRRKSRTKFLQGHSWTYMMETCCLFTVLTKFVIHVSEISKLITPMALIICFPLPSKTE